MKLDDTRHNPNELPPPTHNGREMVSGEHGDNPIDICAARAGITQQQAEIALQVLDETMNSGDDMMRGSLAQAITEAIARRDREWMIWLGKIFLMLDAYSTRQSGRKFIRMSILTMGFVLGCGELLEIESFSAISRRLKMAGESGKQAVNKCAGVFLEKLALAPMLTGRTEAAKKEMELARLKQLKKHEKNAN